MITSTTPPDKILQEMDNELPKVLHYLKKSFGSSIRYRTYTERCIDECRKDPEHKDIISDVIDYANPVTGNRWKAFQLTRATIDGYAYSEPYRFLYWSTVGSVGAAVLMHNDIYENGVVVFTSHFFQRLAERMNAGTPDIDLVCSFLVQNYSMVSSLSKDGDGRVCIDMRCVDGICRGYVTECNDEKGYIAVEIRTFIPDRMLSRKQLRMTERVRSIDSSTMYEPEYIAMQRVIDANDSSDAYDIGERYVVNKCKGFGMSEAHAKRFFRMRMMCLQLGLAHYGISQKPTQANIDKADSICSSLDRYIFQHIRKYPNIDTDPMFVCIDICYRAFEGFDGDNALMTIIRNSKDAEKEEALKKWMSEGNHVTHDNFDNIDTRMELYRLNNDNKK